MSNVPPTQPTKLSYTAIVKGGSVPPNVGTGNPAPKKAPSPQNGAPAKNSTPTNSKPKHIKKNPARGPKERRAPSPNNNRPNNYVVPNNQASQMNRNVGQLPPNQAFQGYPQMPMIYQQQGHFMPTYPGNYIAQFQPSQPIYQRQQNWTPSANVQLPSQFPPSTTTLPQAPVVPASEIVKPKKRKTLSLSTESGDQVELPKHKGDTFATIAEKPSEKHTKKFLELKAGTPVETAPQDQAPAPQDQESVVEATSTKVIQPNVKAVTPISPVESITPSTETPTKVDVPASKPQVEEPVIVKSLPKATATAKAKPTTVAEAPKAKAKTPAPLEETTPETPAPKAAPKSQRERRVYNITQLLSFENLRHITGEYYKQVSTLAVEAFSSISRTGAPPKGRTHSYQRGQTQKTRDIMPDFGLARSFQKDQFGDQPELQNRSEAAWIAAKGEVTLESQIGNTLNKATPDNVDIILNMLLDLNPDKKISEEFVEKFGRVLFAKAIREPGFSPLYIQLGKKFIKVDQNPYFRGVVLDIQKHNEKVVNNLRTSVLFCAKEMLIKPPTPTDEDRAVDDPFWIQEVEQKCKEFQLGNIRFIGESIAAGFLSASKLKAVIKLLFPEFPVIDYIKRAGHEGERMEVIKRWEANRPPLPKPFRFDLFSLFFLTVASSFHNQQLADPRLVDTLKDRLTSLKPIIEYFRNYPGLPIKQKFGLLDLVDLVNNGFVVDSVQKQVSAVSKATVQQQITETEAESQAAIRAGRAKKNKGKYSSRDHNEGWSTAGGRGNKSRGSPRRNPPNIKPRNSKNDSRYSPRDSKPKGRPKFEFVYEKSVVIEFAGLIDDFVNNDFDVEEVEFAAEFHRIRKESYNNKPIADLGAHLLLTLKDIDKDYRREFHKVVEAAMSLKLMKPIELGKSISLLSSQIDDICEEWSSFPSLLGSEIRKAVPEETLPEILSGFKKIHSKNAHLENVIAVLK